MWKFIISVCLLSLTVPFMLAVISILCGGMVKILDSKKSPEDLDRISEVVFTVFFFLALIGYLSYRLFNS